MKTPREVLLGQHQAAEAKLDAIRAKVVAGLAPETPVHAKAMPPVVPRRAASLEAGWRQFFWSLRWHLGGLSAAWLVVLALNLGSAPAPAPRVARQDVSSPRQMLAALRENQRQLRELTGAPVAEPAPEPQPPRPSPRSQIQRAHLAGNTTGPADSLSPRRRSGERDRERGRLTTSWLAFQTPLPNPLPARSSRREGARSSAQVFLTGCTQMPPHDPCLI